jgi:hypothetical protein
LLTVIDHRLRDDISPLPFVQERIRATLQNMRRVKRINEIENKIYQEALADGRFEVYSE